MQFFTHLECSVPCGARCWRATISMRRAAGRAIAGWRPRPNMWRYRELMPLFDGEQPVTLGEGWTPLLHARLGARSACANLFVKDESLNPTGSSRRAG